jgi:uncharacterized protein with ATP-grasp and redox domains
MVLQDELDEQQDIIDKAVEVLEEAYTPEASRADLVNAVSQALDILSGEDEEEHENGEDDE